jgi:predicted O-methyltransferase YrrM
MGCRITAIEDDHEWLDATRQALAAAGVASRVDLQHVPFDFDHPENFPESRYCQALADDLWDVVIIDGQDKTFRGRISCFRHAEPLMRLGASSSLTTFGVMKMNCLSAIRLKMLKFLSRSALVELV